MKHEFQSFWYGNNLSPYETLCLKSFIDRGHSFILYAYDELVVPSGVEVRDASKILPSTDVFFYKSGPGAGSVAAFANKFRYALLYQLGGWWVDMDIVCLQDEIANHDCFFSFEEACRVNNAMLRFPAKHPVMSTCLEKTISLGRNVPWGAAGPKLLTDVLDQLNMLDSAQSADSCYPIAWREYMHFFDPRMRLSVENRTRNSIAVHLWNEMIRRLRLNKQKGPPRESYLDHLCKVHEIEFPDGRLLLQEMRLRDSFERWKEGKPSWLQSFRI